MDVEKLALLARIKLDSQEKDKLQKEFEGILDYVSKLKEMNVGDVGAAEAGAGKNVFRGDENPHKPGEFSEDLLKEAPLVEKGYIKVKHILQ